MIAVTEQVLQEMAEAIVREVGPSEIWLFGSRARGQADPASDVDLLIVEREPFSAARGRLAEITRIRRALSAFRIAKDVLVFSEAEVLLWRTSLNHIIARCLREGRRLYGRP
jgi:predicted nucleotidyltransferase